MCPRPNLFERIRGELGRVARRCLPPGAYKYVGHAVYFPLGCPLDSEDVQAGLPAIMSSRDGTSSEGTRSVFQSTISMPSAVSMSMSMKPSMVVPSICQANGTSRRARRAALPWKPPPTPARRGPAAPPRLPAPARPRRPPGPGKRRRWSCRQESAIDSGWPRGPRVRVLSRPAARPGFGVIFGFVLTVAAEAGGAGELARARCINKCPPLCCEFFLRRRLRHVNAHVCERRALAVDGGLPAAKEQRRPPLLPRLATDAAAEAARV